MQWLWQNPGPEWQWVGLAATLVGSALSLAAVIGAWLARGEAKRAVEAARKLKHAFDASDLVAELERLESAHSRIDFSEVASQANRLRGAVVRFQSEAEAARGLTSEEKDRLLAVRRIAATITEAVANRRTKEETKSSQIRVAIGELHENLNAIVGRRRADIAVEKVRRYD